ncbi:hypothetical protein MHEL_06980 [Mycolicibacterium helvum]|uniref:Uncharacterized protein n=1 Tax=Mycolicibacterium helvum TaxID=1534349 RepID=A0A7I7T2N6_9MYCO|nr:hypothetical protein MHEL_06980 [Mycolicibacterium helvum]
MVVGAKLDAPKMPIRTRLALSGIGSLLLSDRRRSAGPTTLHFTTDEILEEDLTNVAGFA